MERVVIAASVGPMQGVQPTPNRKPSTGAAASPTAGTLWTRQSRWSNGITPANTSPSRMVNKPRTTVISRAR